jgi:hypothetical protein
LCRNFVGRGTISNVSTLPHQLCTLVSSMKRIAPFLPLLPILLLVCGFLAYEHFSVARPVAKVLASDPRNEVVEINAGLRALPPKALQLNLTRSDEAAPLDLWRSFFQIAEYFAAEEQRFEEVQLQKDGETVFLIAGSDFTMIGEERIAEQNPIYMLRKLPPLLKNSDGSDAYGEWSGGMLGVLTQELHDLTEAAAKWANGPEFSLDSAADAPSPTF